MRTVYKYLINSEQQLVDLPRGAILRSVGVQNAVPVVWYEVDTSMPETRKVIEAIGTGHEVPRGAVFLGTVQIEQFVWHLYEVTQ